MEKPCLPPSTELIPDEYDLRFDGTECIHIFVLDSLVKQCAEFLKTFRITLREDHIHKLDSRTNVIRTLEKVSNSPHKEESLLLLIFWGYSSKNGAFNLEKKETLEFYEIWTRFCNERWRNTPKVFLLNVIELERGIQIDSAQMSGEYRTPNGGDIMVVFKQNCDLKESKCFIEELGRVIEHYGQREDMASLVTVVQSSQIKSRPIIISTMLKKLFLLPSEHRGHHFELHLNHHNILLEFEAFLDSKTIQVMDPSTGSETIDAKNKLEVPTPERRRSSQAKQINDPTANPQRRKSSASKKPHWVGP